MQIIDRAAASEDAVLSRPTKTGPRMVYLHVPRSGGSNLWHSAAHAFSHVDRSIHILDIYHESLTRFQTIYESKRTVAELGLENLERCLIHHHTSFGLWRCLGDDFTSFTILRDPVERAISYYFHSLNRHYEVDFHKRTYQLKRFAKSDGVPLNLGDETLSALLQVSAKEDLLAPEAIPRFIVAAKGEDYYVNFMRLYLEMEGEHDSFSKPGRFDPARTEALADKMKRHFARIFFSVDDAFNFLEEEFGQKIEQRNRMPNRARRLDMKDPGKLRLKLLPYFKEDYRLLDILGATAAVLRP